MNPIDIPQHNPRRLPKAGYLRLVNDDGVLKTLDSNGVMNAGLDDAAGAVPFNVKSYGATGDGVTDDTADIQDAITAAQTSGSNGVVYFPPGTYKCNLVVGGNLQLIGSGMKSVGDWQGVGAASRTILVPNNDALPIIKVTDIAGTRIERMELKGNGAGVTTTGLLLENITPGLYVGAGLFVFDTIIRRCTSNFKSNGGCNVEFSHCGLFQGTTNIDIPDLTFAHSYLFNLCSIGGFAELTGTIPPASPVPSRILNLAESGSFVTFMQCEMGNCKEFGTSSGVLNIYSGNMETITSSPTITIAAGQLSMTGTRVATLEEKSLVRSSGVGGGVVSAVSLVGLYTGPRVLLETNNWFNNPHIKSCGTGKTIKTYTDDFLTLKGTSPVEPLIANVRLESFDRSLTGTSPNPIIFDVADINVGTKYNTTNGRWTPGKIGYYEIGAAVRLSTVPGGYAFLRVHVNGAAKGTLGAITSGGAGTIISGSPVIVYMDADDYATIELEAGGAVTVQAYDYYATTATFREIER